MEHIAAFMLLLACSDDLQTCTEQPAPAIAYETMQDCELELSPALLAVDVPNMKPFGKCVEVDPALFYEDAELVWDVTAAGEVEVAIELINPDVDGNTVASSQYSVGSSRLN